MVVDNADFSRLKICFLKLFLKIVKMASRNPRKLYINHFPDPQQCETGGEQYRYRFDAEKTNA